MSGNGGQDANGLFRAGLAQHQAGRLDAASALYRKALALMPLHADALERLGAIALQKGEAASAAALIERSLGINRKNPTAHYNLGLARHAEGDIEAALGAFRRAATLEPRFVEAHNNIGAILVGQPGRLDEAIATLENAVSIDPQSADAHNNLALAYKQRGDATRALEVADAALAADPKHLGAHNTRATILLDMGEPAAAEAAVRRALKIAPRDPKALNHLGLALKNQGKHEPALAAFRRATGIAPRYATAHHNLGVMLRAQSKLDHAVSAFERTISLTPADASAHRNLGATHIRLGNIGAAVACFRKAVALEPDRALNWQQLATCLGTIDPIPADTDALWADVTRCLTRRELDPAVLARTAGRIVMARADTSALSADARSGTLALDPRELEAGTFVEMLGGETVSTLMERTLLQDSALERLLTAIRRALLDCAAGAGLPEETGPATTAFACALAQQCFLTEFAYFVEPDEDRLVDALAQQVEATLARAEPVTAATVALLACYRPLHTLNGADGLADRPDAAGDGPFARLVTRQLHEPRAEQALRQRITSVAEVADTVSLEVRAQYEESPYPRWQDMPPVEAQSLSAWIAEMFPHLPASQVSLPAHPSVLIAGCGTGKQAIDAAMTYTNVAITALDLSRASLAYGMRKGTELDVANIDWLHGDILDVRRLDKRFDVIECSGVLHHMRDPLEGWRALLDRLTPGGLMRIGLYSELARREIVEARAMFAAAGEGEPFDARMRRFRRVVLDLPEGAAVREIIEMRDFFSMSMCRDLIAHVQEHRFTLPQIADALEALELAFLGFELHSPAILDRYRARFPEDGTGVRLDLWHQFETENPETFRGMYGFWVQRA